MMSIAPDHIEWRFCSFADLAVMDLYMILQLRQEVFVVEQQCPYLDTDGEDPQADHLMGFIDEQLVLYTRLFHDPERATSIIGRVIVKLTHRKLGLGYVLMKESEKRCRQLYDPKRITLGAQAHLESFYSNLGYSVYGDEYDEDGIPHLPMDKFIPPKL